MNNRLYGNLIFELSKEGRKGYSLPRNNFGDYKVPQSLCRAEDAALPECDELTVVRHYTNLSNNNFGVDTGFYPLGSCTMKYNPKINEEMAALPQFQNLCPYWSGSLHLQALCRRPWRAYWSDDYRQLSPFSWRLGSQESHRARFCPRHESRLCRCLRSGDRRGEIKCQWSGRSKWSGRSSRPRAPSLSRRRLHRRHDDDQSQYPRTL